MITFIHTADIHYGMENYGRIDPKTGIHTRLLDFDRALHACVDKAIACNVDFFLFCGDAYKTATPSPTQQRLLFKAFLRLQQAHIPIIIIVGNHDNPLTFGKAHALEIFGDMPLTGFHVIAKPTILPLKTKNGPINIVGIPWPTRNALSLDKNYFFKSSIEITQYITEAVSTIIKQYAQKLDPQTPAVLAGHLTVSSGIFSGSEKRAIYGTDPIFLPSQLAIHPFDYVALGHLHRHQDLNPNGFPPIVYSGSIERIDFGERKEPKGFCFVTIHKKNKTNYEFFQTPTRPFIQIEVQLTREEDQTQTIINSIKHYDITEAILKIVYIVPPHIEDQVDINAIQKFCKKAHFLTGITPVKTVIGRERRSEFKKTRNIEHLLESYFSNKPECAHARKELIEQALEFVQKVED